MVITNIKSSGRENKNKRMFLSFFLINYNLIGEKEKDEIE